MRRRDKRGNQAATGSSPPGLILQEVLGCLPAQPHPASSSSMAWTFPATQKGALSGTSSHSTEASPPPDGWGRAGRLVSKKEHWVCVSYSFSTFNTLCPGCCKPQEGYCCQLQKNQLHIKGNNLQSLLSILVTAFCPYFCLLALPNGNDPRCCGWQASGFSSLPRSCRS